MCSRKPLLVLLPLLAIACGDAGREESFKFTAIPDQDQVKLQSRFEPVADYLSRKLGVKAEYVPVADYAASVQAFKNGDILVAWFGGLTGVQARHAIQGSKAIIMGKEDKEFVTFFIARKDSGLKPSSTFPKEIEGRTFTFGSRSSTSGHLMPRYFVETNAGNKAEGFFASVSYSGSHDKTAEMVASGAVEVGALNYKVFEDRVRMGKIDPEEVLILWKTPPYADYNITAHPDLDERFGEGFTDRLQKAFLEMKEEKLLRAFLRTGFIEARNSDFEGIRKVAEGQDLLGT